MRRRGTTLVEMLCVIVLMLPVAMLMGGIFHSTLGEIPQLTQSISVHARLDRVVLQMQKDVDAGLSFPDAAGDRRASDKVLLIAQPGKIVCFTVGKDKIVREELPAANGTPAVTHEWALPDHKTSFARADGPDARAVEIKMAVVVWADGRTTDKLVVARRLCLDSLLPKAVR